MRTSRLPATSADASSNRNLASFDELVKRLRPINRLAPDNIAKLVEKSTIERFASKEDITEIVRSSVYVHYLADGALTLGGSDGKTEHLKSDTSKALKAIERRSGAYKKILTVGPCALIKVPWELLEDLLLECASAELPTNTEVEVSEIFSATITDWMVRILQSDLFSLLPATNIQEVLAQMVLTPASANQAVVGEGAAGEHFYIVESGQYVVTKKAGATGREIKLATLGPGDSFGEAALITDTPRYATVTASKSGNLLKLDSGNFRRWVMDPAISRVSGDEAKSLSDNGDQWIDVREPAAYADGSIPSSLNIGINDVRLNVNRLATDRRYLVCHSDPKIAALGAFLLGERGFNVRCLDAPIKEYCEKFAVEAVISERENSSRTGRAATDDQEPMLLDGGGQQGQPPQTSVDKALPAGVDSDTTDPATMAQLALDVEHVQQLPDKNSIAKPDLNETVLGIGLTDLVGGLARTSAESSVNNSCDLAEAQTSDSLNSTNDGAPITRSAQPAGSDEQMTSLDCASETVALEERKEELPEHVPERSRDDVSTTNVVELHVTKDSGDATNKLKTGGSDQLGVFQQPSLADGPQRRSLIDLEASLSKDAEQVSGEMGAKVTEIVNRYLDIQRTDLEHEFENRITAVKQDAAKSMRAHELKVATGYKAKRQRIIDDGQKLVEFANKLKRFKDDLQRSQKQLEHQLAAKTD